MLKRIYRLPTHAVLLKKKTITTPYFSAVFAKNNLSHNRLAFIVSKKVDQKAVVRNRIRRQFRSCIEVSFDTLPKGYDLRFFLKKQAVNVPREALCESLNNLFKNL